MQINFKLSEKKKNAWLLIDLPALPPRDFFLVLISNHAASFSLQSDLNLHLWVLQKVEIALADAARAISALSKTHSRKLIPNWTWNRMTWLPILNMKSSRGVSAWIYFLKRFFRIRENVFQSFPYKFFFIVLLDITGLENFSLSFSKSYSRITMCNLHWCCTFRTGVTLELYFSQPIRIE